MNYLFIYLGQPDFMTQMSCPVFSCDSDSESSEGKFQGYAHAFQSSVSLSEINLLQFFNQMEVLTWPKYGNPSNKLKHPNRLKFKA